jgi:hypothetical protein
MDTFSHIHASFEDYFKYFFIKHNKKELILKI